MAADSAEPLAVLLALAGHPPSPNRLHTHWVDRWRRTSAWRDAVCLLARCQRPPAPYQRAQVAITLVHRRRRFYDPDNLVACVKPIVDGLLRGGVLADDGPAHIELEVQQEVGPRRCVRIAVWPLPAEG